MTALEARAFAPSASEPLAQAKVLSGPRPRLSRPAQLFLEPAGPCAGQTILYFPVPFGACDEIALAPPPSPTEAGPRAASEASALANGVWEAFGLFPASSSDDSDSEAESESESVESVDADEDVERLWPLSDSDDEEIAQTAGFEPSLCCDLETPLLAETDREVVSIAPAQPSWLSRVARMARRLITAVAARLRL